MKRSDARAAAKIAAAKGSVATTKIAAAKGSVAATVGPIAAVPKPRARVLRRLSPPLSLDRRGGVRPGTLSAAEGIDPRRLPELCPLAGPTAKKLTMRGRPTGMAFLEGRLYVTTIDDVEGGAYLHCYNDDDLMTLAPYAPRESLYASREIVQFNIYSDPTDPLGGTCRHMGLVFPDAIAFPLGTDAPTVESLDRDAENPMPRLSHVCVHLSRLFGAKEDRLYASAYNDPRDFNLDTAADTGAANAWAATVQSNTSAGGDFTALTVFDGQVHAFKEGFCHVLSNTKNPFRISDLFAVGAACPRSVAEVGGKLFFADKHQIYRYNGDTLSPIGEPLGVSDLSGAVGCGGDGMYYLYLPSLSELFVYAIERGAWSSLGRVAAQTDTVFLAASTDGPLLLDGGGSLYRLAQGERAHFSCSLAPVLESGEALLRLCRLSLAVEGESGARVCAFYTDLSGRKSQLLDATLPHTGLSRLQSRMFTPADRGGYLSFSCEGRLSVQTVELVTETQE